MRVLGLKSRFSISLLLCLVAATPAWCARKKSAKRAPQVQEQPAPPAQPTPPPPPPTLAELPAQPPQVTYQNGQLTIIAKNSTLGDILEAVHQRTGAQLDVPTPATERVVTHLGPGPARDVLAALLNGSHFNYVMVGAANNPAALDRVILTPNPGGDVTPPTQAQNTPPQPPPQADQTADDQSTDDFASDDNSNVEEVQPLAADSTGEDQSADQQQAQDQQPNNGPNQTAKTPEQLLLELQQRQQRQLQLQQGQGGTAPTPGAPQGFPLPPGQPQPQPPQ